MRLSEAFEQAILDDPADDFHRLAYADWLEENAGTVPCERCERVGYRRVTCPVEACRGTGRVPDGRAARAEFLRVQIELAKVPDCDHPGAMASSCVWCDRRDELRRRELELWKADTVWKWFPTAVKDMEWWISEDGTYSTLHGPGEPPTFRFEWRRGFPSEVSLTCADLLGGTCGRCGHTEHVGIAAPYTDALCPACGGTGRTAGHAGALFAAAPIEKVTLTGKQPFNPGNGFTWYPIEYHHADPHDLPAHLPRPIYDLIPGGRDGTPRWKTWWGTIDDHKARTAALDALSAACVCYGQQQRKGKK